MEWLTNKLIVVLVFIALYLYIIIRDKQKGLVASFACIILLFTNVLNFSQILSFVKWNVIGIFAGTLLIAELFIYSRVPELLAAKLIKNAKTVGSAILWVCVLTSILSVFIENIATVLIIAPIALELSKKLKISPVPFLISIAISSNLQGTATLIGDPPSMILAGYEKMNFNDFFFFQGKPGIFFIVQLGAIASFFILYLLFRKYKKKPKNVPIIEVKTWVPTWMLIFMIFALAISPIWDPEFKFLGGLICVILGIFAVVFFFFKDKIDIKSLVKKFDWDTLLFLACIFILIGLLEYYSVIELLKDFLLSLTGGNRFFTFTLIVWFSVFVSAFICNVPYITAMIPVVHRLGIELDGSPYFFVFGLLIGSCLGGNITPFGASANIVSVGILRNKGYEVSFKTFLKIGLPFTIAATLAGYIALLFFWG